MDARTAIKSMYKKNRRLFSVVDEFNHLPVRYMHPSWVKSWFPESIFLTLKKNKRIETRLSKMILHRFGLDECFIYEFDHPFRRLALMPSRSLIRLVLLVGICLNAETIACSVRRKSVQKIKAIIGERGYRFGVHKAPFLVGRMKFEALGDLKKKHFGEQIRASGIKCLQIGFSDQPEALNKRMALKLPKQRFLEFDLDADSQVRRQAKILIKKVYKHEVKAECRTYFS